MKKILSGILALMIAGTMTLPVFAEVGDITAAEVKINDGTENLADSLKTSADDEEGMLRISSSDLLKIKLKLESDDAEGKHMSFLTNKMLESGAVLGDESIQFIDEKTVAADGTVTIQFRPRMNQSIGIYNMRANAKDATMFSKFYKTVADEIQPSLSKPDAAKLGKKITLTVSGYTELWKNANNLYDITGDKTEITNYTITPDSQSNTIATLEIPTAGLSVGTRTFRFEPKTAGGAYNPITFTAEITEAEKEYTISFDDSSIEAKTFTESSMPIGGITLPSAEKTGYTFGGWYKENTFVNEVSSPITAANLADIFGEGTSITLYAKQTPITYNITYHNMDGVENSNPTNYTIETATVTLSSPEKTGYNFDGWYADAELTEAVTEIPTGSTGAKDFYAKWTAKTYTITYNKNGGTIENENNYTSYTHGIALTLPTPVKDGFYFDGWYDNEQLSGDPVSSVLATDTENKTFWAMWVENAPTEYQITFVDYDGTELKKGMVNVGEMPSCEEPSREQDDKYTYVFAGWTPDIEAVSANATYTAAYTQVPRDYKVTYEKDGGIIADEENYTSYTYGTALTLPTPTKDGFDFDGWYSDSEFNNKITEISSDATGDKTVYAKWNSTVNYKIISIDENGESVKLIKRTADSAWLIVATYKDSGNLVKAAIKDITSKQTSAEGEDVSVENVFDGDYDRAKAFMWNNLQDMLPRCDAYPEN